MDERRAPCRRPRVVQARGSLTSRAVVLLSAFDPPTNAHVDILRAAAARRGIPALLCPTRVVLARRDDRLLSDEQRFRLLEALASAEGFGLRVAEHGTYLEVARELKDASIDGAFVIGSDKLPQLADPSFYAEGAAGVDATFREVDFIVVERGDHAVPPGPYEVMSVTEAFSDPSYAAISATEVRRRVRAGLDVNALVPAVVAQALGRYTSGE
jgi:nicotinic acid mononucleotide adenylyltransferase